MAQTNNLWSVLRYDLKTALEVVGLPCCLKLADDTLGCVSREVLERSGIGAGSLIKVEKEVRLPCVRARIGALADRDWFVFTKGEEFVRERERHVGRELYLPLGCRSRFRLTERQGGTQYNNIREVVADFPRYIRVEQDTVCASSSRRAYHVVHAGTELELDRVTEGNRLVRGRRENYLICTDKNNHQEYTFQVFSPGLFTKMPDNTKYTLAELVERLALPRTIESLRINPYDVVSADDDDAKELLLMLSGPIEVLEISVVTTYVGLIQSKNSDHCDIITIPGDGSLDTQTMVYIPMSYIMDGTENPYSVYKLGHLNMDVVREGLYLRTLKDRDVLLLKNLKSRDVTYGEEDLPDTPRLPRREENYMTLKSTVSAPTANEPSETDAPSSPRKRFLSTGDIKHRKSGSLHSPERESRGIRAYLSQLTRRMKSSASQLLLRIDSHSTRVPDSRRDQERVSLRRRKHLPLPVSQSSGFVCYIYKDFCDTKDTSEPESNHPEVNEKISNEPEVENSAETIDNEIKQSNTIVSIRKVEDAIYAYIDRTSRAESAVKNYPCSICQENLEVQALQDNRVA